ncbi:carboxymuconolactone decarboxylase family protein [Plantactinospora sonchi]|uniref:Carboxymuconolactone decarboxylase family protein n=1 Tax=Plantactinospora sonchi TaxID=1544735 RepID=A0ABU7S5D5_9ACTN
MRIPLFPTDTMTPAQQQVYDKIVHGPRGRLVGPLRVSLHRPDLADAWQHFGQLLRFDTSLPRHLNELAIIVTARRWNAQVEWHVHAPAAVAAGIEPAAVEAIRTGRRPEFTDPDCADVYEFARLLQQRGDVPDDLYDTLVRRWGPVGMVDLSSVIGYYTLVSMTLNVHEVPVPDGAPAPLPPLGPAGDGLPVLPPCHRTGAAVTTNASEPGEPC